jgi:hypothetical protein
MRSVGVDEVDQHGGQLPKKENARGERAFS